MKNMSKTNHQNLMKMQLQYFAETPAAGKEFLLNFKNTMEIDTAGNTTLDDVDKAAWAPLKAGISTITPAAADTTDNTAYFDGEGFTDPLTTGKAITFAMAGHRVNGDPAQDYVAKHFLAIGMELRTLVRWTDPIGNQVVAVVTMTAIVPFGGAANAKQTFSFTVSVAGKPKAITAKGVTSVTLDKPTASIVVGAIVKLVASVLPANATNKAITWKSSDDKIATVGTDGTVTGIAVGKATITATSNNGKTASCVVTVTDH